MPSSTLPDRQVEEGQAESPLEFVVAIAISALFLSTPSDLLEPVRWHDLFEVHNESSRPLDARDERNRALQIQPGQGSGCRSAHRCCQLGARLARELDGRVNPNYEV